MSKQEFIDEVNNLLAEVKACISQKRITFETKSDERKKNLDFLQTYSIDPSYRYSIINELTKDDLCQVIAERIKDPKTYGKLFVFKIVKRLNEKATGKDKDVIIYIKLQLFKIADTQNATLVISFHEAEGKLEYFKW